MAEQYLHESPERPLHEDEKDSQDVRSARAMEYLPGRATVGE